MSHKTYLKYDYFLCDKKSFVEQYNFAMNERFLLQAVKTTCAQAVKN